MPEMTPSNREAARRIGISEAALRKAEKAERIVREPDGQWDIDKTRRRLTETADPHRSPLATPARVPPHPACRRTPRPGRPGNRRSDIKPSFNRNTNRRFRRLGSRADRPAGPRSKQEN